MASCSHLPLAPKPWPVFASGHLGSSPTSMLILVWARCPPERRWVAAPGPASASCAGPTTPSDPASRARGYTGAGWPRGLSHRRHPGFPRLFLPLLAGGSDRTARHGPRTPPPPPPLHPVVSPSQTQLPVICFFRTPRAGVG